MILAYGFCQKLRKPKLDSGDLSILPGMAAQGPPVSYYSSFPQAGPGTPPSSHPTLEPFAILLLRKLQLQSFALSCGGLRRHGLRWASAEHPRTQRLPSSQLLCVVHGSFNGLLFCLCFPCHPFQTEFHRHRDYFFVIS